MGNIFETERGRKRAEWEHAVALAESESENRHQHPTAEELAEEQTHHARNEVYSSLKPVILKVLDDFTQFFNDLGGCNKEIDSSNLAINLTGHTYTMDESGGWGDWIPRYSIQLQFSDQNECSVVCTRHGNIRVEKEVGRFFKHKETAFVPVAPIVCSPTENDIAMSLYTLYTNPQPIETQGK